MSRTVIVCLVFLSLCLSGCGGLKWGHSKLPAEAVHHLERCGVNEDIVSAVYGECDHSRLYTMGFREPNYCWTVVTSDSVQVVYSAKGEWLYSVVLRCKDDLDVKYFSDIPNADRMLEYLQIHKGKDVHIVGVSREKDRWCIAAYETHRSYMGPPQYFYFGSDGISYGSKRII